MPAVADRPAKSSTYFRAVKPLNDYLLVRIDFSAFTEGGIRLPDVATMPKDKIIIGEVVAVGPGQLTLAGDRQKMDARVGDRVAFNLQSAERMKFPVTEEEGTRHVFVSERNTLAVMPAKEG